MNLQSSRMRDQMARIIRDEVRQVLRDELQQAQKQKSEDQQLLGQSVVRKARRLQPVMGFIGTMPAPPQPQQMQPQQQQQPQQEPQGMEQQQQPQQQAQQQLAQEMESNLLKLKKVISETQALAEKMESFLNQVGQQN